MAYLDESEEVVSYLYEGLKIPYLSNKRTGKLRTYNPDFVVTYVDGTVVVVEIKPSKRLLNAKVVKKHLAATDYCKAHGMAFIVVTEKELKSLGLL